MVRIFGLCLWVILLFTAPGRASQIYVPSETTEFGESYVSIDEPARAPPIVFKTEDGQKIRLSEKRGKVLLVNFWATWCPPCIAEMPSFDRLAAKYGAQGFEIVALSQDINQAVIRPFYDRLGLKNFDIYIDEGLIFAAVMDIPGLPATFVADRAGRIVGAIGGATDWDSAEARAMIEHYLAMPQS